MKMPLVGLGTSRILGEECTEVIKKAFEIGYRHFDTAHIYRNHQEIGRALKDLPRQELFITSKLWENQYDPAHVDKEVDKALEELKTDYLDLLLIHWPMRGALMQEMIFAMAEAQRKGKVKALGVSNFTIHHLQDLEEALALVSVNQVEFHPYLYQKELLEFCNRHHIQLVGYRPLGKGELITEPTLDKIAKKYYKTTPQIILKWIIQKGVAVIPKAASEAHLKENLALFDFILNKEDSEIIDNLNRDQRFCIHHWSDFSY